MNRQSNLILDMRHIANDLKDYGHLAFHNETNDFKNGDATFWTEQFEQEMVKMMKLIKRYNDEVKELVK
tara:strand:+ start:43 stop:249 length:207 start_codon:yes stop_codon:yes gene_type:complete